MVVEVVEAVELVKVPCVLKVRSHVHQSWQLLPSEMHSNFKPSACWSPAWRYQSCSDFWQQNDYILVKINTLNIVHMHTCVLSLFSHVWLFATPWTVARQAPLSMGFSRQEYWNELPCPHLGDLPNSGTRPKDQTQVSYVSCIGSWVPNH